MTVGHVPVRVPRERAVRSRLAGPLLRETMTFRSLRLLDHHGPLTALEVADELVPMMRLVGAPPPGPTPPLLHALEDAGLVTVRTDRPPRYRITAAGRAEAERLAPAFRPAVSGRVARIDARVAILFYEPIPD